MHTHLEPRQDKKTSLPSTTTSTFAQDVLMPSLDHPVLVDFWAPWCGPCRQLTPILEKYVQHAKGRLRFFQLNVDEYPEIPTQLRIQSLPTVYLFQDGQPVDGFTGLLPESQIKAFLEKWVGPLEVAPDTSLDQAHQEIIAQDFAAAEARLKEMVEKDPRHLNAFSELIRLYLQQNQLDKAQDILAQLPQDLAETPDMRSARASLHLAREAASLGSLEELEQKTQTHPQDYDAHYDLALILHAKNRRQEAADALLCILREKPDWKEGQARIQLLQLFDSWGMMDVNTIEARRKLSRLLFR